MPTDNSRDVFLNIPYDERFQHLYLAYISGLAYLDLQPHVALEVPGGMRRLNRIFTLIKSCRYSIHDLSRVEVDINSALAPRFNMPFELGLAVAWEMTKGSRHQWFVFETENRRIQMSLSDLNGTDANIHGGTVEGVMRELNNAFVRPSRSMPKVPEMLKGYEILARRAGQIKTDSGAKSLFEPRVFFELYFAAQSIAALSRSAGLNS